MRRTQSPVVFELLFNGLAEAGPWDRTQTRFGDRLASCLAFAVGAVSNAAESRLDFIEDILLARKLTKGEIMFEIVGGEFCGIQGLGCRHSVSGQFSTV